MQLQKETNTFKIWKTLNQQWVLIAKSTKILYLFFSLSALGPIHLLEKNMDDAQTQILSR
jgi:hypothetical protein